jgi:hypothetical protein
MSNHNDHDEVTAMWQQQALEPVVFTVEELRRAAAKFSRKILWRNLREYAAAAVVVVWMGFYFVRMHSVLERLGCALCVAGIAFVMWRLYRGGAAGSAAEVMDANCLDFYRAELVRQRDLLKNVWRWYLSPMIPGMVVFLLGTLRAALEQPGAQERWGKIVAGFGVTAAGCAAVFVAVGWLNARAARKLQRKIDELDAARSAS